MHALPPQEGDTPNRAVTSLGGGATPTVHLGGFGGLASPRPAVVRGQTPRALTSLSQAASINSTPMAQGRRRGSVTAAVPPAVIGERTGARTPGPAASVATWRSQGPYALRRARASDTPASLAALAMAPESGALNPDSAVGEEVTAIAGTLVAAKEAELAKVQFRNAQLRFLLTRSRDAVRDAKGELLQATRASHELVQLAVSSFRLFIC